MLRQQWLQVSHNPWTNGLRLMLLNSVVTAVVGAAPLFGLSLLGYLSALGALIVNAADPAEMPAAGSFVCGGLATLILLAGLACVSLVVVSGGRGTATHPA